MNHPRSLIKVQILIWWMCSGAWDSEFLTSCWCYGSVEGRLARPLPCPCGQGQGCQPERVAHCVPFTLHWSGHEVQAWPNKVPTGILFSCPQLTCLREAWLQVEAVWHIRWEMLSRREERRGERTGERPNDTPESCTRGHRAGEFPFSWS